MAFEPLGFMSTLITRLCGNKSEVRRGQIISLRRNSSDNKFIIGAFSDNNHLGYIHRCDAAHLTNLMDERLIHVEGVISKTTTPEVLFIPCEIHISARQDASSVVRSRLSSAKLQSKLLKSFVEVRPDSHFPIQNLPYGAFKLEPSSPIRLGVAIGDNVLDLWETTTAGLFKGPILKNSDCFLQPDFNRFMSLGRPAWKEARATIQMLLSASEPILRDNPGLRQKLLLPMDKVEMVLPVKIGDYTNFFSSMHHARNCGTIFRGLQNALSLNWFYLPVACHARASSVVISGSNITRPRGQAAPTGYSPPVFGPSQKLDFGLEMAAVVGVDNQLGKPVDVNSAADHIFGLLIMNDWSARDIEAWEHPPLGPFISKSLGTSVSPWIVTLEALEPFACAAPSQDPHPLPYLTENNSKNYDIQLEVQIKIPGQTDLFTVTRSNFKNLYWTLSQQIAHHTITGCNLRSGDLVGTGTISGPEPESVGSLLELTLNGQKPIQLGHGTTRTFLEDGDEVIMTAYCKGEGYYIGFGKCSGKVLPSTPQ